MSCPFAFLLKNARPDPPRVPGAKPTELLGALADSAGNIKLPNGTIRNDPSKYRNTLAALREVPACVGFHLCGAYLRNRTRNRGLRGPDEAPDAVALEGIVAANQEMGEWTRRQASAPSQEKR